jgi:exodeoxyribonuclease VII small subunit
MDGNMIFERALERVEEITELLAAPGTTVDQSVGLYKEASDLLAFCSDRLARAKLEVDRVDQMDEVADDEH